MLEHYFSHKNPKLDTLDFTGSEHWAAFNNRAESCVSSKILCSIAQSQRKFISAQDITVLRKNVSSQECCLEIEVAERNEAILRPVSLHVSHSHGQIIFLA